MITAVVIVSACAVNEGSKTVDLSTSQLMKLFKTEPFSRFRVRGSSLPCPRVPMARLISRRMASSLKASKSLRLSSVAGPGHLVRYRSTIQDGECYEVATLGRSFGGCHSGGLEGGNLSAVVVLADFTKLVRSPQTKCRHNQARCRHHRVLDATNGHRNLVYLP